MTRRAWWIFLAVQLVGLCALVETAFMGMITAFWPIVPFVLLLPGSLTWLAAMNLNSRFTLLNALSGFTLLFVDAVVAIVPNLLLFVALSSVLKKIRSRHPEATS